METTGSGKVQLKGLLQDFYCNLGPILQMRKQAQKRERPPAPGHKGRKWPTWTGTPQPELPSPLQHLNAEWRGSYAGTRREAAREVGGAQPWVRRCH